MSKRKNEPLNITYGIRKLVPKDLERKLFDSNSKVSFYSFRGWSSIAIGVGILFDLSQVRWVEIGAVVQLTLLIESALNNKIKVKVALPSPNLTLKELDHLERLRKTNLKRYEEMQLLFKSIQDRKRKALNYLKVIGFENAARCSHLRGANVEFIDDFSRSKAFANESVEPLTELEAASEDNFGKAEESNFNYKLLVPLTWINAGNQKNELKSFEELFQRVLSDHDRGISTIDALTIKNVVISELVKNVLEHSDSDYGLIAVALQPTKILNSVDRDGVVNHYNFYEIENDYLSWLSDSSESYIDIYFGDSGTGLITDKLIEAYKVNFYKKSVSDYDLLKWSFDKWSTSKTEEKLRGTKGLYRINRVVNKYNGFISIRTKDILGGFQKGGYESAIWVDNKLRGDALANLPGTLLRMHFSPFREISKLNLLDEKKLKSSDKQYHWNSRIVKVKDSDPEHSFINENSISNLFKSSEKNLLLIFDFDNDLLKDRDACDIAINENLKFLSLVRHPIGIVVYGLPGTWDYIELKIDSVNQEIADKKIYLGLEDISPDQEAIDPDQEDVFDPILILGTGNDAAWLGGNKNVVNILNELYSQNINKKKLNELDSFKNLSINEKAKIQLYFNNDDSIISISNNNEVNYNFVNLISHFESQLKKSKIANTDYKDKTVLTPTLRLVKGWIDVKKIIGLDMVGYAFAMYLLYSKEIETANIKLKILVDSNESKSLAKEFCKLAGINPGNIINLLDEIDGRLPRRNEIFEKDENVLIITTIISSEETIRRSVKAIQRDGAIPQGIMALINQSNISKITTWGREIPIVPILKDFLSDNTLNIKNINTLSDQVIINPQTFKEEKISINNQLTDNAILDYICSTKALHFNHLGRTNGRHFTFYLNPINMVSESESANHLIYEPYVEKIKEWKKSYGIDDFNIWYPRIEFKEVNPLSLIASKIINSFPKTRIPISSKEISRTELYGAWNFNDEDNNISLSENLVIIDWGSLTGSTIQQILNIAVSQKKRKIFVCLLFSQFSEFDKSFYCNIRQLTVYASADQSLIFSEQIPLPADVSIKFIYNLPLNYYEAFTCPVCEHIKALGDFGIRGKYMNNFRDTRRNRLKIKEKSSAETQLPPQDFYSNYTDDLSELNSVLILKMFKLRTLFSEALTSTHKRFQILQLVKEIDEQFESEKSDINSNLYAFLYFLSIEIMWLQKPPLVFNELRRLIAKISAKVAVYKKEELESAFCENELFDKNKISVRYKFAAISVLRSSDKLTFCENIYNLFISTKRDNSYSHNLTQNLFYHIHSLLIKPYHQSEIYFNKTEENLDKILLLLTSDNTMSYVVQYLKILAQRRKYALKLEGKSDLDLIKSLKKEIDNYYGVKSHPEIWEIFREMSIENYRHYINGLDYPHSEKYEFYLGEITSWIKTLQSHWVQIAGYIESVVNNHIQKLNNLLDTDLFKRYRVYDKFINNSKRYDQLGYDDEFYSLIRLISNSPKDIKEFYQKYLIIYNELKTTLLSSSNTGEVNSILFSIANQFPTEPVNIISHEIDKLKQTDRIKIVAHFEYNSSSKIFYPFDDFTIGIKQILSNMIKHCQEGIKEINLHVKIEDVEEENSERQLVLISFENTGTKDLLKNKSGGLSQIGKEITLYGGSLDFEFTDKNIVILKFLKYGE